MKDFIGIVIIIFILSCIHKNDKDNTKQNTYKFIELDTITNGIHTVIVGCTDSVYTEDTALTYAESCYNPYLIIDNVAYKIKNYEASCSISGLWSLSPNGKILIIGGIRVRHGGTEEESFIYDRSHCFAINVETKEVIREVYGDGCDGEWDEHGNLISNNRIYFSSKEIFICNEN
jgi:hypothetical protein